MSEYLQKYVSVAHHTLGGNARIAKNIHRRHAATVLCALVLVFAAAAPLPRAYAADALPPEVPELRIPFPETTVHRVEVHPQNKNILLIARYRVAQGDGHVPSAGWCGPRLLMFAYGHSGGGGGPSPFHGGFLLDVLSRKMWKIGKLDGSDGTLECSPDGKWLIYAKKTSDGKNLIRWRYHIETGKKEPFMRLNAPTDAYLGRREWSPDAMKILYFQKRMGDPIKTDDPQWEVYWLGWERGRQATALWLADSANILVKELSDPKDNLSKSVMWVARSDALNQRRSLSTDFELMGLKIDQANRVYGFHDQILPHAPGEPRYPQKTKRSLYCCVFTPSDRLACETAIAGNPHIAPGHQVNSSGDAIYYADPLETTGERCLWRYDVKSQHKQCLWKAPAVFSLNLSPDAKYLAFESGGLYPADEHGQTRGFALLRVENN